jgi:hypothetical protein
LANTVQQLEKLTVAYSCSTRQGQLVCETNVCLFIRQIQQVVKITVNCLFLANQARAACCETNCCLVLLFQARAACCETKCCLVLLFQARAACCETKCCLVLLFQARAACCETYCCLVLLFQARAAFCETNFCLVLPAHEEQQVVKLFSNTALFVKNYLLFFI